MVCSRNRGELALFDCLRAARSAGQGCNLESRKQVALQLLEAFDEQLLLQLLGELLRRGLICLAPQVHQGAADAQPRPSKALIASLGPASQSLDPHWKRSSTPSDSTPTADLPSVANSLESDQDPVSRQASGGAITTLVIRNLPPWLNQETTQQWLESKGYTDLFDFLLWRLARRGQGRGGSAFAVVNFKSEEAAERFRRETHLTRLCEGDGDKQHRPLRVAPAKAPSSTALLRVAAAKVQGFMENCAHFQHLSSCTSNGSWLGRPYCAEDASRGGSSPVSEGGLSLPRGAAPQAVKYQ